MYLKRLELKGFKSFPDKIKLDFKQGITAVVGPNGSGKSNISDAIRWVLGEQSAKNLRGDKMEDVIFAGTLNRKPLGFAEVSIVLDNSDGKIDLDFSEVIITRRVYRSGESEYLINGNISKLKYIYELFMDTGIGKEGYSIIGQGKIEAILSNKSDDRRTLFEEAVGIVKFKNKKIQTENKLTDVKQNLIRTKDIISEIEKQLIPLSFDAEKTKKYLALYEELKTIQINSFVYKFEKFEFDNKNIIEKIQIIDSQINDERESEINLEEKRNEIKINLEENENEVYIVNSDISDCRIHIEKQENEIKLFQQKIEFLNLEIKSIENNIIKNKSLINTKNNELDLISAEININKIEFDLKTKKLIELQEKFDKFNSVVSQNEELIKEYNHKIISKISEISNININRDRSFLSKEQSIEKQQYLKDDINILNSKIREIEVHKIALDKELKEIEIEEDNLNCEIEKIKKEEILLIKNLKFIKDKHSDFRDRLNKVTSKHKVLNDMEKDYEGYFYSVKSIFKEKTINSSFSGVCGVVGELIKVDKKFEVAIEMALGNVLQNIITRTEEDAKIVIEFLKKNNSGRATFLPISSIKYSSLNEYQHNILNEDGVINTGDKLIKFSSEYANIFYNLLGKVVIVDNINNAIRLFKKYKNSCKLVTLNGEIFNTNGSITGGGSTSKNSYGILSRGRQIQELKVEIDDYTKILNQVKNDIYNQENILKINTESLNNNNNKLQELNIEKIQIKNKISQVGISFKENTDKVTQNKNELEKLLELLKNLDEKINIYDKKITTLNYEINTFKSKISEYEGTVQSDKLFKNFSIDEINSLRLSINSLQNNLENLEQNKKRILQEVDFNKNETDNYSNELLQKNEELNKINICIDLTKKEISKLNIKLVKLDNIVLEKNSIKKQLNLNLEEISKKLREVFEYNSNLNSEKVRLELKLENLQSKKQQLCNDIWENYNITYASAFNYQKLEIDFNEIIEKEKDIKGEISKLDRVNLNAVDDYNNLKERYNFNVEHKNDIIQAMSDLEKIIKDLTDKMEVQFNEQFNIINQNFGVVFSEMFDGGTAKLILSNEENVLTSSIDIVARPPGKNLQNMTLLSGGERTLTAMALLFSILKMKPSPFCILDETEAALDDANVIRFAKYVKNFSKDNQFIVITHKVGTMEYSDILYGVTMEEHGISKVISVELNEVQSRTNS